MESAIILLLVSEDRNGRVREINECQFKWFKFALVFLLFLEGVVPSFLESSELVLTLVYELILLGMSSLGMTWDPK